ncbi:FAD-binding domain-containing protein [Daldinia caldariorum]|uniref:FAD-binding domain-containing protein n=1 Tax=Daldinia caldariorum TaxID=326644 RepID=UPI0020072B94|nr:FAD-binding domain-containing protein [Daldinia caldariorum]KAI1465641.1 FAD-binding domain-containing protein [Daldinia caldariorum]
MKLTVFLTLLGRFASTIAHETLLGRHDIKTIFTGAHWSINTTVSFPGSDSFTNATVRWSTFHQPTYAVAVSPATEADVIQAVKLATSNGIPFLATGGRHGYTTTLGALNNGLAIDLGQFDTIRVDQHRGTLTIGGAVTLKIGTCSCPGMVGVSLGPGLGPWGGVHGLVIDALLSLHVVTANGTLIEVSKSSNPDLFWAFRGAGANFGIVLSATYQLQKQVNNGQVFVLESIIPNKLNHSYFDILEQYDGGKLPKELAIFTFIAFNSTTEAVQLRSIWTYFGPETEARNAMKSIYDLNPTITSEVTYGWNKVIQSVSGGSDYYQCQRGSVQDIYTINARNLSTSTYKDSFERLSNFYEETPAGRECLLQMSMYPNQAALAVPDDETAYPWRDTIAILDLLFTWKDDTSNTEQAVETLAKDLRRDLAATSGYPELAVYINSAHGDETLESRYGARDYSWRHAEKWERATRM